MDTETGKWTPCAKTDGDLECDVKGLQTGKRYRFRVRAKNDEGESEPLEGPDDATLIKVWLYLICLFYLHLYNNSVDIYCVFNFI